MKISKINLLILFTMSINAFLSIPLIIVSILKKKESPFLIGLFFGVLGFYFQLNGGLGDIGRYYSMFDLPAKARMWTWNYHRDLYAKYMVEFLIKYDLPRYLLGSTSAFITYFFSFKSLKIILDSKKEYSNKERLGIYILFYSLIPIIGYTGIRFFPALSIILYSIVLKYKFNNKKYIFFAGISCLVHTSMLLPMLILILSSNILYVKFFKNIKSIKILSLLLFILGYFFINSNLVYEVITLINNIGYIYISPMYISGKWGEEYKEQFVGLAKIVRVYIILNYQKIITLFYGMNIYNKTGLSIIIIPLTFFYFITQNFRTISARYFYLLLIIYFIIVIEKRLNLKKLKYKLFFFMIISYSSGILFLDLKNYISSFIVSYEAFYKISLLNIIKEILF